jgi:hypothetical protein
MADGRPRDLRGEPPAGERWPGCGEGGSAGGSTSGEEDPPPDEPPSSGCSSPRAPSSIDRGSKVRFLFWC